MGAYYINHTGAANGAAQGKPYKGEGFKMRTYLITITIVAVGFTLGLISLLHSLQGTIIN